MNYDVIIIGAGPGGIFAAFELIERKPELKIAISTPMIKEESCKMRERIKHGCGMQRKETEGCHYE